MNKERTRFEKDFEPIIETIRVDRTMSMSGNELLMNFERVLVTNLGDVGKFLLEQQLKQCNMTRADFTENDVEEFIQGIKQEFAKVIGYGVEKLEDDLRKSVQGDDQ